MSVKKLYELKEEFDKVLFKLVLHNADFDVNVYANLKYRNIIYKEEDKDIGYYFEKKDLNVYLDLLHEVYKVDLIWYAICPHNILYTSIHSPTDDIFDEYIGIQEEQFGDVNILSSINQNKDE
jgi:hypothetical protein